MTKGDMNLIRAALFELKKESDDFAFVDLIRNKIFDLEKPIYQHLVTALKLNIKKKITSIEAEDGSKKITKSAVIEIFDDLTKGGAPTKSIILPLVNEEQKKQLDIALDSTDTQEFREVSAKLGNFFVNQTGSVKGVVGFVQFNLQISNSPNSIEKFIAILMTDFNKSIMQVDEKKIWAYLTNAFSHNFKITMLYPYLTEEIIPSKKKELKPTVKRKVDKNRIKIHYKKEDPAAFSMVGALQPKHPQKEVEKIYRERRSEIEHISELKKFVLPTYLKEAEVNIKINNSLELKVDLNTFNEKFEMFISNKGQGIFVKGGEIEVFLGKKNLLSEQKIRFKSINEILKNDNKR
tara:strand:+ start:724 stop:1773 length:1050 start_codon:yes stop_codon:yes gene_type:complete